ncbi:MAG: hypothetical protein DRJ52_05720 [Thermoprotei archaeon]|nr:MAG: hypothetical protein DRJ52_05720 [Thermoprotei archaeon]
MVGVLKVLRKFYDAKRGQGYIKAEVEGLGQVKITVRRDGNRIFLGLNGDPTVPKSKLELLLLEYDGILDEKSLKKLAKLIEREVYDLVNRHSVSRVCFRRDFFGARVYVYEDYTVKIFDGGEVKEASLDSPEELKEVLMGLKACEGRSLEEVAAEIERLFREIESSVKPFVELKLGSGRVRYVDGTKMRLSLVAGDAAYFLVWVYGEHVEGNSVTVGAKSLVLRSDGRQVRVAEPPPSLVPDFFAADISFVRNCVLDVRELAELLEEIEKVNRGDAEPPSWREVYGDIVRLMPEYVGASEEVYNIAALFTIYHYFYDLVDHAVYLIVTG